ALFNILSVLNHSDRERRIVTNYREGCQCPLDILVNLSPLFIRVASSPAIAVSIPPTWLKNFGFASRQWDQKSLELTLFSSHAIDLGAIHHSRGGRHDDHRTGEVPKPNMHRLCHAHTTVTT